MVEFTRSILDIKGTFRLDTVLSINDFLDCVKKLENIDQVIQVQVVSRDAQISRVHSNQLFLACPYLHFKTLTNLIWIYSISIQLWLSAE